MNISIQNLRDTKDGVRCDRIGVYGNPFELVDTNDPVQRDVVCDAYNTFFNLVMYYNYCTEDALDVVCRQYNVVVSNTWKNYSAKEIKYGLQVLVEKAKKEKSIRLLCWCYPKRCHTQTTKRFIEENV